MAYYLFVLLVAGLVFAPTQGTSTESMLEEIRMINMMYKEAILSNDVDTILSMYAPDVKLMPEGYPAMEGTQVLKAGLGWIANVADVTYTIMEMTPMCDDGSFVLERKNTLVIDKMGNVMMDGKSTVIWKMTDSGYKIYVDMYNKNGPGPKAVAK